MRKIAVLWGKTLTVGLERMKEQTVSWKEEKLKLTQRRKVKKNVMYLRIWTDWQYHEEIKMVILRNGAELGESGHMEKTGQ